MLDKEKIGKQLKELRLSRGWRQSEVADKVSLSRPAISNIEAGRRALTISTLQRFCEIYHIDISYFGIETDNFNEAEDLAARVEALFRGGADDEEKEELYQIIMKLYLDWKNHKKRQA